MGGAQAGAGGLSAHRRDGPRECQGGLRRGGGEAPHHPAYRALRRHRRRGCDHLLRRRRRLGRRGRASLRDGSGRGQPALHRVDDAVRGADRAALGYVQGRGGRLLHTREHLRRLDARPAGHQPGAHPRGGRRAGSDPAARPAPGPGRGRWGRPPRQLARRRRLRARLLVDRSAATLRRRVRCARERQAGGAQPQADRSESRSRVRDLRPRQRPGRGYQLALGRRGRLGARYGAAGDRVDAPAGGAGRAGLHLRSGRGWRGRRRHGEPGDRTGRHGDGRERPQLVAGRVGRGGGIGHHDRDGRGRRARGHPDLPAVGRWRPEGPAGSSDHVDAPGRGCCGRGVYLHHRRADRRRGPPDLGPALRPRIDDARRGGHSDVDADRGGVDRKQGRGRLHAVGHRHQRQCDGAVGPGAHSGSRW